MYLEDEVPFLIVRKKRATYDLLTFFQLERNSQRDVKYDDGILRTSWLLRRKEVVQYNTIVPHPRVGDFANGRHQGVSPGLFHSNAFCPPLVIEFMRDCDCVEFPGPVLFIVAYKCARSILQRSKPPGGN